MAPGLFDYDRPDDAPFADGERILSGLTDGEWRDLESRLERRRYPAGVVILRAGEDDRALHVIASGRVEVLAEGRRGRRRLAVLDEGAVIGEMSFLDGRRRSADVVALTDVETLSLGFDRFLQLSAWRPRIALSLALDLGRALAGRLRRSNRDV
ncbi:MAG: cyclic nucleotide-binding domain-containing protein [Hyphomicrobiales bacterium]|nr:cyclic nucleotide-binding domain-containing protein [Hyphomicrobiales bacterium]MDE2017852.1 cyclic nucleotide-binding domain-containing protein [Hyphomicrobiales bacterium]